MQQPDDTLTITASREELEAVCRLIVEAPHELSTGIFTALSGLYRRIDATLRAEFNTGAEPRTEGEQRDPHDGTTLAERAEAYRQNAVRAEQANEALQAEVRRLQHLEFRLAVWRTRAERYGMVLADLHVASVAGEDGNQ